MSETTTVRVSLAERSYDIAIGAGLLSRTGAFLQARRPTKHAIVITDAHVEPYHATPVCDSLAESGCTVDLLVVDPGESMKSVDSCQDLWDKLLELGADRKTVVVALGGGVIGDLAGFIAASFARGLPFLQIPTTLLAHVDSSVGGKVGVNLPGAKNMVGAFWQPLGVVIDTQTLSTLPDREFRSGLAEVVKYGVILDAEFFAFLEQNVAKILARDATALRHVVARSCRLKADVVENDEREETGLRAVLNYGHTFGHAFEALTGYDELLHGEAVSIGMHCAAQLAERLGRVDAAFVRRQELLLDAFGLPKAMPPVSVKKAIQVMARDKKAEEGKLNFILPTKLGHVELVRGVSEEVVAEVLRG